MSALIQIASALGEQRAISRMQSERIRDHEKRIATLELWILIGRWAVVVALWGSGTYGKLTASDTAELIADEIRRYLIGF